MTLSENKGPPVTQAKPTPTPEMPFRLRKNPRDQSILHALLPGSRLDNNTNKILVNTATSNETIKFNVGGTYFETCKSTLRAIPQSVLADDAFLKKHHRSEQNDYFFDRDPEIFHCILNYHRSGELHLPNSVCGPVVKSELEYWGIEEIEIEECCWSRYSSWASTLQSLRKLEADRTGNALQWQTTRNRGACCRVFNQNTWNFFVEPNSSWPATIYSYISLAVIFITIFCFCAETHDSFKVKVSTPKHNQSLDRKNHTLSSSEEWQPHSILQNVDFSCFIFILVELVVRFVVCPRKCHFALQATTVLELFALLPDVCALIFRMAGLDYNTAVLDMFRVFRVFRIFRLMRQIPGLWILIYTLKASIKDLILLLLFLCLGMLIFSSLIFFAEKDVHESQFTSIPKSFWWAVITMTTVGYGDMSPETKFGYFIGTLTAVSGLLMIGFTVPVLVNNFVLYYHHTQSAIEREKQRAKKAKLARAKVALVEKAKCQSQQNQDSTTTREKPGMGLHFDVFKQKSNGLDNNTISNNEINLKEEPTKVSPTERQHESDSNVVDNKDLNIIIDESDVTERQVSSL